MEDKIFDIVTDILRIDITKSEAIDKLLFLHNVSGSASDFEKDLGKLINDYIKVGLKKSTLVKKMEWMTGTVNLVKWCITANVWCYDFRFVFHKMNYSTCCVTVGGYL